MDVSFYRTIIIPIFIFIGIVGNVLSIITVSNKHCKKSSYTVLLTALAIADLLTLVFVISDRWAIETFNIPMTVIGPVYCKLHMFVVSFFIGMSTWIIVILAIERTFCIYRPMKAKSVCKPNNVLKTLAVLVVINLCYTSHLIYGGKLGIRPDHVWQTNNAMNATITPERNDTETNSCNDLITSSKTIREDKNENIKVGIENFIINDCKSNGIMGLNDSSLNAQSPGNDTQASAIRCSPSRMNEGDILIGWSFADNGNTTDTLNDDLIDTGNVDTDQSGRVGRLGVDENNSTDFEKGDIDQTGTPTPPTMNSADTDKNVPPSQSKEVTAKRDYAASSTQPQNDTPESDSTTVLTQSNDPQDKATCVFVSKNYINFYRIFILFDGILQFCIPVALLIGCNTATWIKVYRTSHKR